MNKFVDSTKNAFREENMYKKKRRSTQPILLNINLEELETFLIILKQYTLPNLMTTETRLTQGKIYEQLKGQYDNLLLFKEEFKEIE